MTGGLIQIASSGIQDIYLTHMPEITFFKKVYRRHTNFSLELKELSYEFSPEYGDSLEFNILKHGDLIHRCYLQVEIPVINIEAPKNDLLLDNINLKINKWKQLYQNFQNFCEIELTIYQNLIELFESENITINILKSMIINYSNQYEESRNQYKLLIDENLFVKIYLVEYILSLSSTISILEVKNEIKKRFNLINENLKYYHSNWKYNENKYNKLYNNTIKYAWSKYLGHYYINNIEIEIGGQIMEKYSSDQFHCYQLHNIKKDQMENYNKMIGNIGELYNFGNHVRKKHIIYIPLIFWFCKNSVSSLPLVAMRYSDIKLNLKLNNLKNILYFQDWENEYNKMLILEISYDEHPKNDFGNITNIEGLKIKKKEIIYPEKIYRYHCEIINKTLLEIKFNSLQNTSNIDIILSYGTNDELTLSQWIILMNDLMIKPSLKNIADILLDYYHKIDYNLLYNLIPKPNIKLLAEYVYLDDIERELFASSQLEYLIEIFQENIFDINNVPLYNAKMDFSRAIKELVWFIRPKINLYGLSKYGRTYPYLFDNYKWFENQIASNIEIKLNEFNLLKQNSNDLYYNKVSALQYLNNELSDGLNYLSFSLFPEEEQPSGSCNISQIKGKTINILLNNDFLDEYFNSNINPNNFNIEFKILTRNYNIFVVKKGQGKLVFY